MRHFKKTILVLFAVTNIVPAALLNYNIIDYLAAGKILFGGLLGLVLFAVLQWQTKPKTLSNAKQKPIHDTKSIATGAPDKPAAPA